MATSGKVNPQHHHTVHPHIPIHHIKAYLLRPLHKLCLFIVKKSKSSKWNDELVFNIINLIFVYFSWLTKRLNDLPFWSSRGFTLIGAHWSKKKNMNNEYLLIFLSFFMLAFNLSIWFSILVCSFISSFCDQ